MRARRLREVVERGRRPDLEVLVVDAHPGEAEAEEVEDVRDLGKGGEQARPPGENGGALSGQGLRVFETGGAVVASDSAREQCCRLLRPGGEF